jgi:citrate synthase
LLLDIALEAEKIFYRAPRLPMTMSLVAIPRTYGWLGQWLEMLDDPEQKITRPRKIYARTGGCHCFPIERRGAEPPERIGMRA